MLQYSSKWTPYPNQVSRKFPLSNNISVLIKSENALQSDPHICVWNMSMAILLTNRDSPITCFYLNLIDIYRKI